MKEEGSGEDGVDEVGAMPSDSAPELSLGGEKDGDIGGRRQAWA